MCIIITEMNRRPVENKYVVGIDEVGRGPLAGPLAVGAILFPSDLYKRYKRLKNALPKGRDSKKMSAQKRESWYLHIKELILNKGVKGTVVFTSVNALEKNGLSLSVKKSIEKCLVNLKCHSSNTELFLDGGLKGPLKFKQKTIIKGDEKNHLIALASIYAKVLRDRKMIEIDSHFTQYRFADNKGYGTAYHIKAIRKYGLTKHHRASFCTKISDKRLTH
jgi:ribonuclease HII